MRWRHHAVAGGKLWSSGCGIATARDIARFYAALAVGGAIDGARTIGHGGAGTSICCGGTDLGPGFAFIPNGFRGPNTLIPRCEELSDAVRTACEQKDEG